MSIIHNIIKNFRTDLKLFAVVTDGVTLSYPVSSTIPLIYCYTVKGKANDNHQELYYPAIQLYFTLKRYKVNWI